MDEVPVLADSFGFVEPVEPIRIDLIGSKLDYLEDSGDTTAAAGNDQ